MAPFTTPLANCADKAGNRFPEVFPYPAAVGYASPSAVLHRNNVRVFGHGKQVMLFCNGFGCSQHIWHRLTASLATRYRLVLFDYVGSGGSDLAAYMPERYASLAGYAQDVVDVCQALDLRDVILVGHSIGASIAMLADRLGPRRLLVGGLLVFAGVYGGVALAQDLWAFGALFAFYGLYAAATEGVGKAWVSTLCAKADTGAALGTFAGLSSLAALVASTGTGLLWQWYGPLPTFGLAAAVALAVAAYLARVRIERPLPVE